MFTATVHTLLQTPLMVKQVSNVTSCHATHRLWGSIQDARDCSLDIRTCLRDADSEADEFVAIERRMWADVRRPTWEEGSHESSSTVSMNPGRVDLPDHSQKVHAIPFHSGYADIADTLNAQTDEGFHGQHLEWHPCWGT